MGVYVFRIKDGPVAERLELDWCDEFRWCDEQHGKTLVSRLASLHVEPRDALRRSDIQHGRYEHPSLSEDVAVAEIW